MNDGTHMNYLALNQNILFKPLRFGAGPMEGDEIDPIKGLDGLDIYINGKHNISEIISEEFELKELLSIGKLTHPHAMFGMPDICGELTYDLGITDEYFAVIVRLKLDEGANGESEPASELLSLIKRTDVPESLNEAEEDLYFIISRSMLSTHFEQLFEFYESYESLINSEFEIEEETALNAIISQFFERKGPAD